MVLIGKYFLIGLFSKSGKEGERNIALLKRKINSIAEAENPDALESGVNASNYARKRTARRNPVTQSGTGNFIEGESVSSKKIGYFLVSSFLARARAKKEIIPALLSSKQEEGNLVNRF